MVVAEEVGLRDSWLLTKKGTSILGLFSLTIKKPVLHCIIDKMFPRLRRG